VKPTFPYLQTPASYAKPYIIKADQLGDSLLTKVDERVPIVKSETAELKGTVMQYASWPMKTVETGKDYITSKYAEEYKRFGGNGYVASGKALISSSLVISSEVLAWVSSFMAAKKAEVTEKVSE